MKRRALQLALLLIVAVACAHAREMIDRLVASVDATPILQSDWDQAVAFEALQQGRPVSSFTDKERRAVLERMVDQQLVRAQIGESQIAAAEERDIAAAIDDLRKLYPLATTDEAWHTVLAGYGFEEASIRRMVITQIEEMRFINLRLRPDSRVSQQDVETYYNTVYTPDVQARGAKPEPLASVSQKIQEILRQQRMDALLNTWLQELRTHSEIRWLVPITDPVSQTTTPETRN